MAFKVSLNYIIFCLYNGVYLREVMLGGESLIWEIRNHPNVSIFGLVVKQRRKNWK